MRGSVLGEREKPSARTQLLLPHVGFTVLVQAVLGYVPGCWCRSSLGGNPRFALAW